MKKVQLWIDDERPAPDQTWVVAKSSAEAIAHVQAHGMPYLVSLDHDLGGDDNTITFIKWCIDSGYVPPKTFNIHSANPVGRENLHWCMQNWYRHWQYVPTDFPKG
jgi:hypothetical protein